MKRPYESWQARQDKQHKAQSQRAALVARLNQPLRATRVTAPPSRQRAPAPPPASRPYAHVAYTPAQLSDPRRDGLTVAPQPWTLSLLEHLLGRAVDGQISLRLVWPAELPPVATLHALATMSRALSGDVVGMRTLFYPGTQASWTSFDRIAIDRAQLVELWRALKETPPRQPSPAFQAILDAANETKLWNADAPRPQLRQLMPAFIYDAQAQKFVGTTRSPLDSLLAKTASRIYRQHLHEKIDPAWADPTIAPGAFLTLPRGLKRRQIKEALAKPRRGAATPIDVCLLDATTRAANADAASVRRIPELLLEAREARGDSLGALIVTDDPTTYLVLRSELERVEIQADCKVLAGEAETPDALVSHDAHPVGWMPAARPATNFKVTILDSHAARLAKKFGAIADLVRDLRPQAEEMFRHAQRFIMMTSNLPGGFVDLRDPEGGARDFLSQSLEWHRIEEPIQAVLTTGRLNPVRDRIDTAISEAHAYVRKCDEHTPIAVKIEGEVVRRCVNARDGLTIVFPSRAVIAVAQRYLSRRLGESWTIAKERITWLSLADAATGLKARTDEQRLLIVGLRPAILRLLITHAEIPKATEVFVPQQRAVGVLPVLYRLSSEPALQPYRARLSGLLGELKRHFDEVPDLDALVKTFGRQLALPRLNPAPSTAEEARAYRFLLEDGRTLHCYGYIYVYDVEEGSGFRRALARSVKEGDLVFEMTDALRERVEALLEITDVGGLVETSAERKLLAIYHRAVERWLATRYPQSTRAGQIRAIKACMYSLKPGSNVSESRIRYWLNIGGTDTAPHGARDRPSFMLFCEALGIDPITAETYWLYVVATRASNQSYGRVLAAWYAEIIFRPESVQVYRSISPQEIRNLRAEAETCAYRVVRVTLPDDRAEERA